MVNRIKATTIRFLKRLGILFCGLGLIVYTIMFFYMLNDPTTRSTSPAMLIMIALMVWIIYMLSGKRIKGRRTSKKPRGKKEKLIKPEITSEVLSEDNYYRIFAALDDSTCPHCAKMDYRVFPMTEWKEGVTAPPFHSGCRCCAAPYTGGSASTRIARDLKSGKSYYIPEMAYSEWWKDYVVSEHAEANIVAALSITKGKQEVFNTTKEAAAVRELSNKLYEERQREQSDFDIEKINPDKVSKAPLTGVEKSFLSYIANREVNNPNVAGYWTYEYNINYREQIARFIVNDYLKISDAMQSVSFLKVKELQDILANAGLKKSGRKSDLISRIHDNLSEEEIVKFNPGRKVRFCLTEKGTAEIASVKKSATKDTDFEDVCLDLIYRENIAQAYKNVCRRETEKRFPRGVGTDWNKELKRGLSPTKEAIYNKFLKDRYGDEFIYESCNYTKEMKASVILGDFLGLPPHDSALILARITGVNDMPLLNAICYDSSTVLYNSKFKQTMAELS